jgi:hypothetical protein
MASKARPASSGRDALAVHSGKVHPPALEYTALLYDAAVAATAFGSVPAVTAKGLAVDALQFRNEAILQREQVIPDYSGMHMRSWIFADGHG